MPFLSKILNKSQCDRMNWPLGGEKLLEYSWFTMLRRIDLLKNVYLFSQTANSPSRNRGCFPVKGLNADASWVALLAFCAVEQIEDLSILSHSLCGAGIRHSLAGFSTLGLKGRPSWCQLSCILIWRLNWERTSFQVCLGYWQNHFPTTVDLRASVCR